MVSLNRLMLIAECEFADIVEHGVIIDDKLRVMLIDGTYIDFWWSHRLADRFANHWERRHVDNTIYRHDNSPHIKWEHLSTSPQHFHFESDSNVIERYLSTDPDLAIREFLSFVRGMISGNKKEN